MDITCDKCQSEFKIPDNKIPAGKTASFLCRKCKSKITISSSIPSDDLGFDLSDDGDASFTNGEEANELDVSEQPFDFAEEEGETALVCESNAAMVNKIIPVLENREYYITQVRDTREAIKKMRYHDYDIIVLNEEFDSKQADSNGVLIYLSRLQMLSRRNIYVTLLTRRFRTMDYMTTLHKSVNLIVNIKDINEFERILGRGLSDTDMFYRVFKESLKTIGII